ncbi:MAG: hypothetical protein IJJ23_09405 [Clostridia bacterium]|nr:hypothetical protein [Clostridia bacterium]
MIRSIIKRDGRSVLYDQHKIANAILKAMESAHEGDASCAARVANAVEAELDSIFTGGNAPHIEAIQDAVERQLMNYGYNATAKAYILYRANRTYAREANTTLMRTINEITQADAIASDLKRDNANIDGNTAMGSMLQIGSAGAKAYNEMYLLRPEHAKVFREGDIYIHDFDFYHMTTTCTQIDILKLFHGGFSTGHGFLREPQSIQSYTALAAIAIQSNQNDQHGGQSIPTFDFAMAEGVTKSYHKAFLRALTDIVEDRLDLDDAFDAVQNVVREAERQSGEIARIENKPDFDGKLAKRLSEAFPMDEITFRKILSRTRRRAWKKADHDTFQE